MGSSTPPPYSHDGPIGHRKRGYMLRTDQSDAGSVVTEYLRTLKKRPSRELSVEPLRCGRIQFPPTVCRHHIFVVNASSATHERAARSVPDRGAASCYKC
eukprot:1102788-Prorocentrum_minimum.AAC.1